MLTRQLRYLVIYLTYKLGYVSPSFLCWIPLDLGSNRFNQYYGLPVGSLS
jgi:hypothetical protein